jgi:hypothetical protein
MARPFIMLSLVGIDIDRANTRVDLSRLEAKSLPIGMLFLE